jgi:hypothetical protein
MDGSSFAIGQSTEPEDSVVRTELTVAGGLALLAVLSVVPACSDSGDGDAGATCAAGECGGSCPPCGVGDGGPDSNPLDTTPEDSGPPPRSDDTLKNGTETDVDCGGKNAPKCADGKGCLVDDDCAVACNYAHKCIPIPSCKPHLGGDTCGKGEVGGIGTEHESCCRSLPVTDYTDRRYPDKTVYLDKYEITAGRFRAFINDITTKAGGKADVRGWVVKNTPPIWDAAWNKFLPSAIAGETVRVNRFVLGDRRPDLPEAPPVPDNDQDLQVSVDFQFNAQLFVYMHGNNCSTHADNAFGFPTWFYPPDVLAKQGVGPFPPRADGTTPWGTVVPASEALDVKSMNCVTNALLAAFCHWDGGQLATNDVLDYVTDSPESLGDLAGCGRQVGWENPPVSDSATKGGRCADLAKINATFDAGGQLPLPGSPLNFSNYEFPEFPITVVHDKAWEISAPGRGSLAAGGEQVDTIRLKEGDEPWMDLAGNLSEAVLTMNGASFSGKFGLKYRGVGYQSARSELNMTSWDGENGLRRIERAEARAGFAGGRCMRFK